jgi:hypothetical protein
MANARAHPEPVGDPDPHAGVQGHGQKGIDDSRDPAKVERRHLAVALDEHLVRKPVVTTAQTPVFA